jgi:DNA repair protein RecO (recombination protein O)
MIWDDIGFLLSKNKYNENSLVAEFYTKDHGKSSGIIFGGSSKKIKNYLQIGNRIHINFSSKSVNRVGYFKVEIQDAISPYFFDDQKKLSCILSAMNLIRILTADSQKNNLIYHLIENFYVILKKDNWLKSYIYWELELLKLIGFDLEFENLVEKNISNKQIEYTSKSIDKRIIPNFLVDKNDNIEDKETLLNGLKLVGDYLDKTILKPNNLNHPISRIQFINTLK